VSTVAIASGKGGVGKTTLALNIALAFARRSWKTLLVDTDPLGGVGRSLGGTTTRAGGLVEYINGTAGLGGSVLHTREKELDLIPFGNLPAAQLASWMAAASDPNHFRPVLAECSATYDLVLVDTPSGLGGPTAGVLGCADHLVIPLQAEPLALRTMPLIVEAVAAVRAAGHPIQIAGLVPAMVQTRNEVSLAALQEAFRLFPEDTVLEAFVPRDPIFLDGSAKGVPVGLLRRRSPPVATVFDQIAAELEPRIGLSEEEDYEPQPLVD